MGNVIFSDAAHNPQQNSYSPFMGAHAHAFYSTWKILPALFAGAVGGEFSLHAVKRQKLLSTPINILIVHNSSRTAG